MRGTVLLIDGGKFAVDATSGVSVTRTPHVADVVLDNGVIYASAGIGVGGAFGGPGPTVLVSDDLGATWEKHDFPMPFINQAPETSATFFGLHAVGGRLTAAAHRKRLFDLDLDSNTYDSDEGNPQLISAVPLAAASGAIAGLGIDDVRTGTYSFFDYDVSRRAANHRVFDHLPICPATDSADGVEWVGWCVADANTGGLCRSRFKPRTDSEPTMECVNGAFVPSFFEAHLGTAVTSRGVLGVGRGEGGRALAYDLVDGKLVFFDLGAGTVLGRSYLQPVFGRFIAVDGDGPAKPERLVDVTAEGTVDEILVPRSPCEHDDRCGTSTELLFLLPLGGERHGAFWVTDQGKVDENGMGTWGVGTVLWSHKRLYYRQVSVERQPLVSSLPGAGSGPLPGSMEATEATPVEKHCEFARACWRRWQRPILRPQLLNACEDHWAQLRVAPGEQDPALQRFLSTPLGDCDALMQGWPILAVLGQPGCAAPACQGNIAVRECANAGVVGVNHVSEAVDCAVTGMSCRVWGSGAHCVPPTTPAGQVPECNRCDSNGVGTTCWKGFSRDAFSCAAIGAACEAGGCRDACGGASSGCQGSVALVCEGEAAEVPEFHSRDCAATGDECMGGACISTVKSKKCATGAFTPCVDSYRLACPDGRIHYTDCSEMGARCENGQCVLP